MATYEFQRQKVGSFQLDAYNSSGNKITYPGINAQETDADIIVGGVQQLLGIVNWVSKYDPLDARRTIEERVAEANG